MEGRNGSNQLLYICALNNKKGQQNKGNEGKKNRGCFLEGKGRETYKWRRKDTNKWINGINEVSRREERVSGTNSHGENVKFQRFMANHCTRVFGGKAQKQLPFTPISLCFGQNPFSLSKTRFTPLPRFFPFANQRKMKEKWGRNDSFVFGSYSFIYLIHHQ